MAEAQHCLIEPLSKHALQNPRVLSVVVWQCGDVASWESGDALQENKIWSSVWLTHSAHSHKKKLKNLFSQPSLNLGDLAYYHYCIRVTSALA